MLNYAAKTGYTSELQRPKSGIQKKNTAVDAAKKTQRALLTWFGEEPTTYHKVKKYISASDFTDELYRKVAERMLMDLENGQVNPAAIINMFDDAKEQSDAALVFQTKIEKLETKADQEKAFKDLLLSVKEQSYQYYMSQMGTDMSALTKAVEGKKALEELRNVHISL